VFSTRVGTALAAANVRRAFRNVAKKAGLNSASWTPRELRHSFVSLLSCAGVSIEDISHLVGHGSTVVTQKVYRQELRPVLTRGAETMDIVFKTKSNDKPIGQQLGQQVAESEKSNAGDEAENPG
jgi:integrase